MKEKQNRNLSGYFFSCFPEQTVRTMKEILESERYIPQEIINITDFVKIRQKAQEGQHDAV